MENNEKIDEIQNVLRNNVDGDDIAAFCLIAGPGRNVAFITGDEDKLVLFLSKVIGEKEISRLMAQASAIALEEKLKILKEKMTKKHES